MTSGQGGSVQGPGVSVNTPQDLELDVTGPEIFDIGDPEALIFFPPTITLQ